MSEETLMDSEIQTNDADEGTIQDGQSNQSAGTPNDPEAFQADYTKKYQELSSERQAFEAEKAAFEARQSANSGYTSYQQPVNPVNNGYTSYHQSSDTNNDQALIEQFGYEGAQLIKKREMALQQQSNQAQYQVLYELEQQKGKAKFGEKEWEKHNYVDPVTGQIKNKVMDLRVAVNPMTGQSLTIDQAWNALNPVNPTSIEEQARQKAYAEMQQKTANNPVQQPTSQPNSNLTGSSKTMEDAVSQAAKSLGLNW